MTQLSLILQVLSGHWPLAQWPDWVEIFTNVSHLATTFNSSVNFYIYFAKHWRIILRRRRSGAAAAKSDRDYTEVIVMEPLVTEH